MHRFGRYGSRFNSTVAEATLPLNERRGVTLRWGTVIIPSREQILKMPKSYSPDLSYLEKAPQNSLAGRLAKTNFQPKDLSSLIEQRRAQRLAREQGILKLSTPESTSKTNTPKIEPPDVAAITQKRIEMRLAREGKNANESIRAVQDNADRLSSLRPLFSSPGPLPLARSTGYPSAERLDDELSPLALKRREERRLRENNSSRDRRSSSRRDREKVGSIGSDDMESETATAESFDSVNPAELEAASPTVHAPEFNGPEPISEIIDVFNNNFGVIQLAHRHGQHSVKVPESLSYRLNSSIIDSFTGGDYSRYTYLSSASNSTSPDASTAVKAAEQALSYQRDYGIPQRKRTIEIVKTLVGTNSVQVAKEKQTTA